MKVIEILNFNRELLKRLHAAGIRLEDARYIDLYADYTRLLDRGEKVSYAVAVLSEKYSVSERKVYSLVKRFRSECNFLIFGGVNLSLWVLNATAGLKTHCTRLAA